MKNVKIGIPKTRNKGKNNVNYGDLKIKNI